MTPIKTVLEIKECESTKASVEEELQEKDPDQIKLEELYEDNKRNS